jgi:hypothetical protein
MTGGTKGGAQRASSLRPRCVGEIDPKTATQIYLKVCILLFFVTIHNTLLFGIIHMSTYFSLTMTDNITSQNIVLYY